MKRREATKGGDLQTPPIPGIEASTTPLTGNICTYIYMYIHICIGIHMCRNQQIQETCVYINIHTHT